MESIKLPIGQMSSEYSKKEKKRTSLNIPRHILSEFENVLNGIGVKVNMSALLSLTLENLTNDIKSYGREVEGVKL